MKSITPDVPTRPIYPMECPLCLHTIYDDGHRDMFHGLTRCAEICGLCSGFGHIEGVQCPPCLGAGVELNHEARQTA